MRVLIYTLANEDAGLGHFYRMKALSDELMNRGHTVWFACDNFPDNVSVKSIPIESDNLKYWNLSQNIAKPDWTIVDLPGEANLYTTEAERLCMIDGIGHPASEADVVISQGRDGEYSAPDYLLLRKELAQYRWFGGHDRPDFVWGGASDLMAIIPAYRKMFGGITFLTGNGDKDQVFHFMALATQAVVASGMILWELAFLGTPTFAFSRTQRHLDTAMWLEELGLVRAYPEIGLPTLNKMEEFLSIPFTPTGVRPNLGGAGRVVELLEEKL